MVEDPLILMATNGRPLGEPGCLGVTCVPQGDDWALIFDAPAWHKPYFTRAWRDRTHAVAVAERLLILSLDEAGDYERDGLYRVIDAIYAGIPTAGEENS